VLSATAGGEMSRCEMCMLGDETDKRDECDHETCVERERRAL
jgi:hypothetical protein